MKNKQQGSKPKILRQEASIVLWMSLPLILLLSHDHWWWPKYGTDEPSFFDSFVESADETWLITMASLLGIFCLGSLAYSVSKIFNKAVATLIVGGTVCLAAIGWSNISELEAKDRTKLRSRLVKAKVRKSEPLIHPTLKKIVEPRGNLRMELMDDIEVTEFSLNGVPLGKLPCEIPVDKLRRLLPKFIDAVRGQQAFKSIYHQRPGNCIQASLEINGNPAVEATVFSKIESGEFQLFFATDPAVFNDQIELAIDQARLKRYEVSAEWCEAFQSYGRFGRDKIVKLIPTEPEIEKLLDALTRYRYGITNHLNHEEAWEVLTEICEEARHNQVYFSNASTRNYSALPNAAFSAAGSAVKQLAPLLDPQQVADVLEAAVMNDQWPKPNFSGGVPFPYYFSQSKDFSELKPIVHAAWEIDQALNLKAPDEYNVIERQVGDALFVKNPPRCSPYGYRDLYSVFQGEKGAGRIRAIETARPIFGSPLADEYVKRQWEAHLAKMVSRSLGDDNLVSKASLQVGLSLRANDNANFGSIKINGWLAQLLQMNSPTGRKFRRENRDEILQLAIRSIGPRKEKEDKIKNRRLLQALGALVASNSFGGSDWPTIPQLEFLMLDTTPEGNEQSLAKEFWPYLDGMIDTFPKIDEATKLRLRWKYLARIWPESNEDAFVDAYFDRASPQRQWALILRNRFTCGLPKSLPIATRMEILRRIKLKIDKLPDSENPNFYFFSLSNKKISEAQTIRYAIAWLPCPEGAKMNFQLHPEKFSGSPATLMEGLSEYRWPLKGGRPFARVAHDDRFDLLVEHEDPKFRMSAVKVIRYLPKPRFMQALPNLIKDSDPEVKAEALKVQDELKEIEEAVLPHRVYQGRDRNRNRNDNRSIS